MICFIIIAALAFVVARGNEEVPVECQGPLQSRVDAWDKDAWPLSDCAAHGFCWLPVPDETGAPWCYYPASHPSVCEVSASGERTDCAAEGEGVTPSACAEKGCCWVPSDTPGQPWCFHASAEAKIEEGVGADGEL
jgi:hypothetical protein